MTEQNPEQPHPAVLELARLHAGLAAGLTVEQSARLNGATPEELTADATAYAAEMSAVNSVTPTTGSGGDRGGNVGATAGSLAAGVAEYRAKHGLDDERRPTTNEANRNPFAERAAPLRCMSLRSLRGDHETGRDLATASSPYVGPHASAIRVPGSHARHGRSADVDRTSA
ncbi:hypothetical protein ABZX90_28630 [Streptomyces sp. NPDC002935]|uniref:hypothetical protein n=1 Tax=Streptomyces sp. NPDC002935 TaxID=3154545 RepID=UPI0033AE14DE